jgi:hypothetical protein
MGTVQFKCDSFSECADVAISLAAWNTVLLEMPAVAQLLYTLAFVYGNRNLTA